MKLKPQADALEVIGKTIPQMLGKNLLEFSMALTASDACILHVVRHCRDGSHATYHRVADSIVVFSRCVTDVLAEIERAEKQESDAAEAAQKAAKRQKDLNSNAREHAMQIGEFNEEIAGYEARLQTNLKAKHALDAVHLNHMELDRRIERDRAVISTLKTGREISQGNLDELYKQGSQRYYTNGEPFNGDPDKAEPVPDHHAAAPFHVGDNATVFIVDAFIDSAGLSDHALDEIIGSLGRVQATGEFAKVRDAMIARLQEKL